MTKWQCFLFKSKDTKMNKLYDNSPSLSQWEKDNVPDENLIYRSGVSGQCEKAKAIATLMRVDELRVISTHTSKSVSLPVIAFTKQNPDYDNLRIFGIFRDNFYDLCCQVISSHKMEVPFTDVYLPTTLEWLEAERAKALKYHDDCAKYERPEWKEDNKIKRALLTKEGDWEWFNKCWSSGKIIHPQDTYFIIRYGWYEGFPIGGDYRGRKYYEGPTKDFSFLARGYPHMIHVFQSAFNRAENAAFKVVYPK